MPHHVDGYRELWNDQLPPYFLPQGSPMSRPQARPQRTLESEAVARSFYAMLRSEGFSEQQIIELAGELLELVANDLRPVIAEAK